MTEQQSIRFEELSRAQVERGPLLGAERREWDRLCELWENEHPPIQTTYAEFM